MSSLAHIIPVIERLRQIGEYAVELLGKNETKNIGALTQTVTSSANRLTVLDATKFIAMIFMIQGHTLDTLVMSSNLDVAVFPWSLWHILRGFTAPVFLTISGVLFGLTLKRSQTGAIDRSTVMKRLRWAGLLLLIAYLLVFPAEKFQHLSFVSAEGWRVFFQVNILHLNAVALVLTLALAVLSRSDKQFAFIAGVGAVLTMLVSPWINTYDVFSHFPESVGAYLSYSHGSLFPIFPFASYMFLGASVGAYLKSIPAEHRYEYIRNYGWKYGVLFAVVGSALMAVPMGLIYPAHDYLQSSPACVLQRLGFVFVATSAVAWLRPLWKNFEQTLGMFGQQSLTIYVVHLIIIFGTPWFPSFGRTHFRTEDLLTGILAAVGVISATLLYVRAERYVAANNGAILRFVRYIGVMWLVRIIFL